MQMTSLSRLILSLDCIHLLEIDSPASVHNILSGCQSLLKHNIDSSRDHDIVARTLLSSSLKCAHRLFVKAQDKEAYVSVAKEWAQLCLATFERHSLDRDILQAIYLWLSALAQNFQHLPAVEAILCLQSLKPHLAKVIQNLRSHDPATRLWTLEILALFAKLDSKDPQAPALHQVPSFSLFVDLVLFLFFSVLLF